VQLLAGRQLHSPGSPFGGPQAIRTPLSHCNDVGLLPRNTIR
jgi:hypothetical protein